MERVNANPDELPPPPLLLELPPPPLLLELPPPPLRDELEDDELREDEDDCDDELDEDVLDDDELELVLLLLLDVELDDDPLDSCEDDVLDPSGPVGEVPHPTPNMPTPARAIPPDSILRNCRRSSRREASSTGCGFSDWLIRPPWHRH